VHNLTFTSPVAHLILNKDIYSDSLFETLYCIKNNLFIHQIDAQFCDIFLIMALPRLSFLKKGTCICIFYNGNISLCNGINLGAKRTEVTLKESDLFDATFAFCDN